MNERLQEYADSGGQAIRVDRQRGIIHDVKILGVRSQNGRTYLDDAIEQAVALYEGAKVNVNHPKSAPGGPRDYQDRIGVIRNVSARSDEGLFGDFHFNPKHALAEQLLWDAEHAPQNVGFSHNVQARTARRGDQVVVEAITKVQSVDLVADPATTRGLFESAENGAGRGTTTASANGEPAVDSMTVDGLRAARPDLVEALLAEPQKQIEDLREEVEQLRAAGHELARRETIERLLAEYDLPGSATPDGWRRRVMSDAFMETLTHVGDEATARRLIRERVDLARTMAEGGDSFGRPLSREQTHVHGQPTSDVRSFVRSIS